MQKDGFVRRSKSPGVLYRTVEEFQLNGVDQTIGQAAESLFRRLSTGELAPAVYQIRLRWPDPDQVEPILNSLLAHLSQQLKPVGRDKAFVESQVAIAKQHFEELQAYAEWYSTNQEVSPLEQILLRNADSAVGYVALVDQIKEKQLEIRSAERRLEGLSEEDILQAPTPPEEMRGPSKVIYAILFASASALFVGAAVLIAEWLRVAAAGSYASEFRRMRNVFGRKQ